MWESGLLDTLTAGSFAALAVIHQQLFAEIDDLAGQLRTVNLGRGNGHFSPALELRGALVHIERMPQAGLDDILAKYLAMNLAHPFPRGNRALQTACADLLPALVFCHLQEHSSGRHLRQSLREAALPGNICPSPKKGALPTVPFRGDERARFRTMPAGCRSPAMAGTRHAPRQAPGIGRPVAIATPLIEAVLSMAGPIAAKAANRPKPISGLPLTPCRLGHPSIF